MSYINSTLQAGERLTASAKVHWITYAPALTWAATGLLLMVVSFKISPTSDLQAMMFGLPMLLIALISLFRAWFQNWTTELAVTDRRVIYKTGFIRRKTFEMNMGKIETVLVTQSFLGRLLDFGTIQIMGTGHGLEELPLISSPLRVRDLIGASAS